MFLEKFPAPRSQFQVKATRAANLLLTILVFTINGLATGLPLNNKTTGQLSDMFPTLITPAGFTFAIWGLIYLFLAAFAIYQALPYSLDSKLINEGIGYWFIFNAIFNSSWIIAWHYQTPGTLWISLVIMLLILATLIIINIQLEKIQPRLWRDFWVVRCPFSLYLGWICGATLINIFVVAHIYVGSPLNPSEATVIGLSIFALVFLCLVGFAILYRKQDAVITLVFTWATFGIAMKQRATLPVFVTAVTVCAVIGISSIVSIVKNFKK